MGHGCDSLFLRGFQHSLLFLLLDSLLLEVSSDVCGDLSELCFNQRFRSDLFSLCIIGIDDLAFDLLLKLCDLSELLPLVPQLLEQLGLVWSVGGVDVDLSLGEGRLLLLLLWVFCSVFLRYAALHFTINLS